MTFILVVLITLSICANVIAQKRQNVYFLKDNGKEVKIKDSADFVRIIREPDSGSVYFDLIEYYPNGKKKRIGFVSAFEPYLKLEGTAISYYENGTKKSILNYKENKLEGQSIQYYQNGKLKESRIYLSATAENDFKPSANYKITQIADSLGNKFLDSLGNGIVNLAKSNGDKESGAYLNGIKHGVWKEYDSKTKTEYEEDYDNGKFVKGKYKTESGETQTYDIKEMLPEFKGGNTGLSSFLSRNLIYPSESRKNREQGRVIVNFVVESDGSLSNIKVVKSVSPFIR